MTEAGPDDTRHLKLLPFGQIGTYVWHPAEDQLWWSDDLIQIYGRSSAPASAHDFVAQIHPDDRGRIEAETALMFDPEVKSYSHTFRILRSDGVERVILDRGTIERDAEGKVTTMRGVNVDVTDEAHLNYSAEVKRRASEGRYRKLFDAIDEGFCILEMRFDLPDGRADYRVIEGNPAFYAHTGFPATILGQWLRTAAPALEEHWYETYARVAQTGQPARFENKSDLLGRWFDVYAFPVDDPKDNHVAVLFTDITERKKREADAQLIVEEISHRSKNMLGVVQVIARISASSGADGFLARFSDRVQALAASHDLLLRNDWTGVPVEELVRSQLVAIFELSDQRISFGGPDVVLTQVATKALGMALHELATNAAKYGAMSTDGGSVSVTWHCDGMTSPDPQFTLEWRERGGPPVAAPTRRGFGTKVTTWMVEANTSGKVDVSYAPEGLTWRLTCPAEKATAGVQHLAESVTSAAE